MVTTLEPVTEEDILTALEEAGGQERQRQIIDDNMESPRKVIDELVLDGKVDRMAVNNRIILRLSDGD